MDATSIPRSRSCVSRRLAAGVALCASLGAAACTSQASQSASSPAVERKDVGRLDEASAVVQEVRDRIPDAAARETRCVVVVPSVVQIQAAPGISTGAPTGHGFAACRTETGWSSVAPVTLSGEGLARQVGAEPVDLLLLVTSDRARSALIGGELRLGLGGSSSAAGPVGGSEAADVRLGGEVVAYRKAGGLLAGAELSDVTIDPDDDTTHALYGSAPPVRSLLEGHEQASPVPAVDRFLAAVRTAFGVIENVGSIGHL